MIMILFSIGDRVYIDGDKSLVARITEILVKSQGNQYNLS